MNAYQAYRRQQEPIGWTRIDMLLALYDGAIERLHAGLAALRAGDRLKALPLLSKAQLIIQGLATAVPSDQNEELAFNLLRLFEFAVFRISQETEDSIQDAIRVLKPLRDGHEAIRPKVAEMERRGQLLRAESLSLVRGIA